MSFDRIGFHDAVRATGAGLTDAEVRVLFHLTGYADTSGQCFPSQGRLADELGWSISKLKRTVSDLQTLGWVEYRRRARHKGERSLIQLRTGVTRETGSAGDTGVTSDQEPVSPVNGTGVTSDTQNSPMNTPKEPTQGAADAAPWVGISFKRNDLESNPVTGLFWSMFVLNIPNMAVSRRVDDELLDDRKVDQLDAVFWDMAKIAMLRPGNVDRNRIWDNPGPLDDPGIKSVLSTIAYRLRKHLDDDDLGRGEKAKDPQHVRMWRDLGGPQRKAVA